MCKILGVSTSGYYKWKSTHGHGETDREKKKKEIKQKIKKSFHESQGTYGSPRVYNDLIEWGYTVSPKTVARYMREMGLKATPEEKFVVTTDSNHDLPIAPNLVNREFNVDRPNAVWVADITYVRTLAGWLYLATIMDLFSRKIVGWSLGKSMKKELTLEALEMAITTRRPPEGLIHHSDRGSQYCSNEYMDVLHEAGIQMSMSRKGDPYDNACIESFHATIKKELIYRFRFNNRAEASKAINYYISSRYNERRKHSTLGYKSPNNFERMYRQSQADKIS